jgi:quercetin dioxygenase-like cupin family protein
MKEATVTSVKLGRAMAWTPIRDHIGLFHREIVDATEADALGVRISSVLWEKIEVGGAVLPHYHDVAEVIYIVKGNVTLLCNGQWIDYAAGDTFHVHEGVVHSVRNNDTEPTEQISIFLPTSGSHPSNAFFKTTKVEITAEEPSHGLR